MAILGVFGVILSTIIPIAILVLIIVAAVRREKGFGVKSFEQTVKAGYVYIIVIVTLFMMISGTIFGISSLLDYFMPESEVEQTTNCKEYSDYDDESLSEKCLESNNKQDVINEKNKGITNFAACFTLVIVSTPIFIAHSKMAKDLREEKKEQEEKKEEKKK